MFILFNLLVGVWSAKVFENPGQKVYARSTRRLTVYGTGLESLLRHEGKVVYLVSSLEEEPRPFPVERVIEGQVIVVLEVGGIWSAVQEGPTSLFVVDDLGQRTAIASVHADPEDLSCHDGCPLAHNGVCDYFYDKGCALGSDCSDCGLLPEEDHPGELVSAATETVIEKRCDDSCAHAFNGRCDYGGIKRNVFDDICMLGTDCTDCAAFVDLVKQQAGLDASRAEDIGPLMARAQAAFADDDYLYDDMFGQWIADAHFLNNYHDLERRSELDSYLAQWVADALSEQRKIIGDDNIWQDDDLGQQQQRVDDDDDNLGLYHGITYDDDVDDRAYKKPYDDDFDDREHKKHLTYDDDVVVDDFAYIIDDSGRGDKEDDYDDYKYKDYDDADFWYDVDDFYYENDDYVDNINDDLAFYERLAASIDDQATDDFTEESGLFDLLQKCTDTCASANDGVCDYVDSTAKIEESRPYRYDDYYTDDIANSDDDSSENVILWSRRQKKEKCLFGTDCSDCKGWWREAMQEAPMELQDPNCNDHCPFAKNGVCNYVGSAGQTHLTQLCSFGTDCSDCALQKKDYHRAEHRDAQPQIVTKAGFTLAFA